jgi:hypothetical protein
MPTITIAATTIDLREGEHYVGLTLNADGTPSHHLVLLPEANKCMPWQAAVEHAKDQGGALPTRREQSLLFANLKDQFRPAWYWSSEEYQDADADAEDAGSFAWGHDFNYGYQDGTHKSYEGRCRAVRRLTA